MPEIDKSLSLVLTLQEKIPEIQNAGKQISMIDEDFASVESTMTQGIQEAKDGLQIINQVQKSMPDIQKLGQDADSLGTVTLDAAKKCRAHCLVSRIAFKSLYSLFKNFQKYFLSSRCY